MKEDQRGKVVDLKGRQIPRDAKGDPAYKYVGPGVDADGQDSQRVTYTADMETHSLLLHFTPAEIVTMCNRYIYAQEYQRVAHRNRARREAEALQPLKDKLRELFDVSHLDATDEQIDAAVKAIKSVQEQRG